MVDINMARALSAESRAQFREAHRRGLERLRDGDVHGLIECLDEELAAIQKQHRAFDMLRSARIRIRVR